VSDLGEPGGDMTSKTTSKKKKPSKKSSHASKEMESPFFGKSKHSSQLEKDFSKTEQNFSN
jgi:hypothetical protein